MLVLTILTFTLNLVFGQTNTNHVKVSGYTRSDGTYVKPHYRTAPNSTNRDNFSTLGNINTYTGKLGWIAPDNDNYVPESGYNYPSNPNRQKSYNSFEQSIPNSLVVFEKVNMYEMAGKNLFHKLLGTEKDRTIIKVYKEEGKTKIDVTIPHGTIYYTATRIKKIHDINDVSFFLVVATNTGNSVEAELLLTFYKKELASLVEVFDNITIERTNK